MRELLGFVGAAESVAPDGFGHVFPTGSGGEVGRRSRRADLASRCSPFGQPLAGDLRSAQVPVRLAPCCDDRNVVAPCGEFAERGPEKGKLFESQGRTARRTAPRAVPTFSLTGGTPVQRGTGILPVGCPRRSVFPCPCPAHRFQSASGAFALQEPGAPRPKIQGEWVGAFPF